MIRRYLLSGLIALLFSVSIYAQYEQTGGFARLRGMGNNPYIVDPYGITVNPAWGGYYQNFLFGDLGSSSGTFAAGGVGQFMSANFHVGGGLSLGGILARNTFNGVSISRLDPFGIVNQLNGFTGAGIPALENNMELMGSFKTGNTAFGLGFAIASTSHDLNPAQGNDSEGSASQLGFNAGIVTKLGSSLLLDLGASLMLPSASFEPGGTGSTNEVSQTLILANVRLFWQNSSKLAFVPTVVFATSSGTFDNGTTSTDLNTITFISVGIGANYQVGDFLFAGGPAFATISNTSPSTTATPELTTSALVFPVFNLGVEWNLNDWFVGRFGYIATTQSVTTESNAGETPSTSDVNEETITQFMGPQGATVGVGFRLGNFSLDATVNEDVLRQGFNNIGGGGATFAYLSLSYSMP